MRGDPARRRPLVAALLLLLIGAGVCGGLASGATVTLASDTAGSIPGTDPLSCVQRVDIPELDQVMESHWSPDGSHLAITRIVSRHVSAILVTVGQRVARGQPVALVGMTGETLGPHTHWEVKHDGAIVDSLKQ